MLVSADGKPLKSTSTEKKPAPQVAPVPEEMIPSLQKIVEAVQLVKATKDEFVRNMPQLDKLRELVHLRAPKASAEEFEKRLSQMQDQDFMMELAVGTFFDHIPQPQVEMLVGVFSKISKEEAEAVASLFGAITAYQSGMQYLLQTTVMFGNQLAQPTIVSAAGAKL